MNTKPNTPASRNEADFSGDFVEHSHPQFGAGFFCTPDVFERITALAAPGAAIDAREQEAPTIAWRYERLTHWDNDPGPVWRVELDEDRPHPDYECKNGREDVGMWRNAVALIERAAPSEALSPATVAQPKCLTCNGHGMVGGLMSGGGGYDSLECPDCKGSGATVAQPVEWGDPKTVGMFVRQLQTIAPDTPIHAAVHTDLNGKRVALTKPVTISRERVQGRHIRQGDQSVPYSIVVWASHDEAAQPCASQGCGGAVGNMLHTFMNAAAGEGYVLDGVDAADLYIALFPERYAAAIAKIDTGASLSTAKSVEHGATDGGTGE